MPSVTDIARIPIPVNIHKRPKVVTIVQLCDYDILATRLLEALPALIEDPHIKAHDSLDLIRLAQWWWHTLWLEHVVTRKTQDNLALTILEYATDIGETHGFSTQEDVYKILDAAQWWLITSTSSFAIKREAGEAK